MFWQAVANFRFLLSSRGFLRQKEKREVGSRPSVVRSPPPQAGHTPPPAGPSSGWFTVGSVSASDPPTLPCEHLRLSVDSCSPPTLQPGPATHVASCHLRFLLPSRGT